MHNWKKRPDFALLRAEMGACGTDGCFSATVDWRHVLLHRAGSTCLVARARDAGRTLASVHEVKGYPSVVCMYG